MRQVPTAPVLALVLGMGGAFAADFSIAAIAHVATVSP